MFSKIRTRMEESDISLAASVEQPKTILLISFISSQKKTKPLTANEGQKPWVGCFWKDLLMGKKEHLALVKYILKFRCTI